MEASHAKLPEEFKLHASSASYHHADDSGKEWHLAKRHEDRCKAIFSEADDALKEAIRAVAGGYLISGWWRA